MDELKKLYEDFGFPSSAKLLSIAKKEGLSVTSKQVSEFIKKQSTSQLHKKQTKNKKGQTPIRTTDAHLVYQMDLLDMSKFYKNNKGHKWILIMVDIFSRKAWATPLKSKVNSTVLEGLKIILKKSGHPRIMHTDQGGEFKGVVKSYLEEHGIFKRVNEINDHNTLGIIDRFSQTLKSMIYKHFTNNETTQWIDVLDKFVKNYNRTVHKSLCGQTPTEAEKYPSDTRQCNFQSHKTILKNDLHIGDRVRIRKVKTKFERSFEIKWSTEIYEIVDKQGLNYFLNNGKHYRADNLQKVYTNAEQIIKTNVVKQATKDRKRELFEKREDIDKSNILSTRTRSGKNNTPVHT